MSDTKRIVRADLDEIVDAVIGILGGAAEGNGYRLTTHKKRWWIEHRHVGSGEPFDQFLRTALERFVVKLPSDEMIEDNGKEGGLRDGELQMFWEGAKWMRDYIFKTHATTPKKGGDDEG